MLITAASRPLKGLANRASYGMAEQVAEKRTNVGTPVEERPFRAA